ncbi:MAG: SUMF1/EgtB/PvdO family nonheme iron enzyme, partial [Chloroflexi bacterium]|nr:SUMF1/EgtB/PvdO family nonheme iron enzyme [Chloroflexota bacterium]
VKGEDLRQVFDHVTTGHAGWNETRALSVLLKVCEAMSYAHDKGVIHRDLKPANVMVGKYGEVYVMDWGLARVLGQEDQHDVRVKPEPLSSASVRTERRSERDETPDSPLVTMDGDVVGTPAYMPPEQARGDLPAMGPHSDVYAVGAMLYHLLAQQAPYMPRGARLNNYAVWHRVQEGPPRALLELAPRAPAELMSICEKAMEREVSRRYRDMPALADDLRAYLERRVVKAYESGTWAETRKWVQRNKPLAASLASAATILVVSLILIAQYASNESRLKQGALAREREGRVRGLISKLAYFETLDDDVYAYARKQTRPATEWWLQGARDLVDGVPGDSTHGVESKPGLKDVQRELEKVRALSKPRTSEQIQSDSDLEFESNEDAWWHGELVKLVDGLERVAKQIEYARPIVEDPEPQRAWREAIDQIAKSEKYRGTKWPSGARLTPQLGLVPIGPDPLSGLWEFAHLATGKPAKRGKDGRIEPEDEMGLVLVLLPCGRVPVANSADQRQDESLTRVELDPFFLSKYEMTAAQWARIEGWRFSKEREQSPLVPAADLSWEECQVALGRNAGWMRLPTEAQWEFGCRATTPTTWWTGEDFDELLAAANLQFGIIHGYAGNSVQMIGMRSTNAFGLCDVHGNVWEWCQDALDAGATRRRTGDGLLEIDNAADRVFRGGGNYKVTGNGSSSIRDSESPDYRYAGLGLRPSRGVTP